MYDEVVLNNICEAVEESCRVNRIRKVTFLTIIVNENTSVDDNSLLELLKAKNNALFGEWTKIDIFKENFQDKSAIVHSIQGEQYSD